MRAWHSITRNSFGELITIRGHLLITKTMTHSGPLISQQSGLHAGLSIRRCLEFSRLPLILTQVECSNFIKYEQELVCRRREILFVTNGNILLEEFISYYLGKLNKTDQVAYALKQDSLTASIWIADIAAKEYGRYQVEQILKKIAENNKRLFDDS